MSSVCCLPMTSEIPYNFTQPASLTVSETENLCFLGVLGSSTHQVSMVRETQAIETFSMSG